MRFNIEKRGILLADEKDEKVFSRRDFLKTTGAAAGGIAGGALLGGFTGFKFG